TRALRSATSSAPRSRTATRSNQPAIRLDQPFGWTDLGSALWCGPLFLAFDAAARQMHAKPQRVDRMRHDLTWRTMSAYDLDATVGIAETVHAAFYEAPEVLAEKQALYPNGAHLLEIGERPVGYVLSHPYNRDAVPALDTRLGALPADADSYYLHDLALLP